MEDARAAFAWLVGAGASPEDVLVAGTSLGTGVAVQAARRRAAAAPPPQALTSQERERLEKLAGD